MTATVSLATFGYLVLAFGLAAVVLAAPFLAAMVHEEWRWWRFERDRRRAAARWVGPPSRWSDREAS